MVPIRLTTIKSWLASSGDEKKLTQQSEADFRQT
jgi:hypothetical protein